MEKSEKYRKYLIKIILNGVDYYTIWGTDLNDEDIDKLLVKNRKLILFSKAIVIKEQISNYKNIFLDKQNFDSWIIEESFEEPYNSTNLSCLEKFSENSLKNKNIALEIIDSINLIQDFYIQINRNKKALNSKLIRELKDNIYNNHFWKNDKKEFPFDMENITKIKNALKKLYDDFVTECKFI